MWLNALKRILPRFRERYPRLPVRIIADLLYLSIGLIELCEKELNKILNARLT